MQKLFKMSDLGLVSYYLGIEVTQGDREITLCQRSYVAKILEMPGLSNFNSWSTPMECRLKLIKDRQREIDGCYPVPQHDWELALPSY
jgi:hypothetical protein